jgi:diguanylate cyclase (GGDEF)-like protein
MNENINFYKFMHKQILVVIALFMGTGPGYIWMGYLYSSLFAETIWFALLLLVSLCGFSLYRNYSKEMTIEEKDIWLNKVRLFMFSYFSLWTIMFVLYIIREDIELHYIAIATQFGSAVVAATILASQKKLVISAVVSLMAPLVIYFYLIGEMYSDLLALFTIVLTGVLLYAAKNTHDYLIKSRYQAYHDHLTTLGNRRYFIELLESSVKQNFNKHTYLLLVDLDYFKTINDTLGHDVGDELLREVSLRMKNLSQIYGNSVARLGGDEFCILSKPYESKEKCLYEAENFSKQLILEIKRNYLIEGNSLFISSSVGISVINNPKLKASQFLKEADIAMYEAKNKGRDGIIIFNEELCEIIEKKLDIELRLQSAIEKNEIYLSYQPQVDVTNEIIGCEVLVRWNNEKLGMVSPDVFIPIAENTGYIVHLGAYILEEAFKTIVDWNKKEFTLRQISINISMRQLLHQDFIAVVVNLLDKYQISECHTKIIFEITESSTTDDLPKLVKIINALKEYDISFSMDDFGTGYSSLSYLREIPINELKIDKSFISELTDTHQALLVKTIIDISKNLNLSIVAEGVEEEYQKEFLSELNCDLYQGFLFSKSIPKEEFEKLLQASI